VATIHGIIAFLKPGLFLKLFNRWLW